MKSCGGVYGDRLHYRTFAMTSYVGMVDPVFWRSTIMPEISRPAGMSKLDWLEAMARRSEGVTALEASWAIGWRPASVRGAISAELRCRRRLPVHATPTVGAHVYHIAPAALCEV